MGRSRKEDRAAGCATLYSHPAAPAGDEADDPDAVPVSPRLAANKEGESQAQRSRAAPQGPQRAALDGVGPMTSREHTRTEEQARPLARAQSDASQNTTQWGENSVGGARPPEVGKPSSRDACTKILKFWEIPKFVPKF